MRKFASAGLGILLGYAVGVVTGVILVSLMSGNSHDKAQEMAMTAAFATGPIGALLGLIVGLTRRQRRS